MKKYLGIALALAVFVGCEGVRPNQDEIDEEQAPEFVQHEVLMTRNPVTGKVEREKLWDYLLNKSNLMGRVQLHGKVRVYPNTWRPVDDFFASLAVQRLVYNPNNTLEMYFCTGEGWNNADAARGAGIWKSQDGGATWLQLASTRTDSFRYCHDMLIHPVTSDIYVATRDAGIMRSKDGGDSWEVVLSSTVGAQTNRATDLELTADNELVACLGNFTTDGVYFSTTGDANDWDYRMNGMSTNNYRIELATAPSNANVMYAIPISSTRSDSNRINGVFRTNDKGMTWDTLALPGGDRELSKKQGWYDLIVKVSPEDENVVLVGGLNVYRTTDGGQSWQQMFEGDRRKRSELQYVHVDQHEIVFKTQDTVLLGNDGGIYQCNNIMADTPFFFSINKNYNVTQFYACDISDQNQSSFVIGGTQDNGSLGSIDTGVTEFRQLSWADGSYCNIDWEDEDIFYTTTQYRRLYRTNHGKVDTLTNDNIVNRNTLFINPIDMDVNDPELLYQLTNRGLWRLKNARTATADDWEVACRPFGSFSAIGISKSKPNLVYIGRTTGGTIYRIDDARNSSAQTLPTNCDPERELPDGYCSSIYVDPTDENHVVVTYSNYGVESVWESKNALADIPSWTSHEGNLPDIPIRWVSLHPTKPQVCYIATEAGVMMTDSLAGDETVWTEMNTGLANLKCNMIRYRPVDSTFVVATHGRGIYVGQVGDDNQIIWNERGPLNVGGRTRTMLFDPNDPSGKKLWAGSVSGGLWVVQNYDSVNTYYDVYDAFSVKLGPNPVWSGEALNLYITTPSARVFDVVCYDLKGAKLLEQEVGLEAGEHHITFDLPRRTSSSYYILQITDGSYKEAFKLFVE